jgi:hypothetical protein
VLSTDSDAPELSDTIDDDVLDEPFCPHCSFPLEGDGSHVCPDAELQDAGDKGPDVDPTPGMPPAASTDPEDRIPYDAVPDPDGLIRSEKCPACCAAPGDPCHSTQDWGNPTWPEGFVHSGRCVRWEHATWLREVLSQHTAGALAESCPHPGCGAAAGTSCPHLEQGRLVLALARAKEGRASSDLARHVLDELHPWGAGVCPVCGSKAKDGCHTRSGKGCMDHHGKTDPWAASRAWLLDQVEAVEAAVYTCPSCQDGARYPHKMRTRSWSPAATVPGRLCVADREREARYAAHPEEAPEWYGRLEPYSPEWLAAHIAANPVLAIPCPECFAIQGEECRHNNDGEYVTCRQRKAAHANRTDPGLFAATSPVMAPPRNAPATRSSPARTPSPPQGQGSLFG